MLSLAHTDWYKVSGEKLTTERSAAHTSLLNILHEIVSNIEGSSFKILQYLQMISYVCCD